ncbi:unnamed protein product, partial [Clonostachys byssicola]
MSLFHDGPVSPVSSWPFQEINLDDSNGPLSAILAQKVVNIYIVFTESQDIKPHAEFQLETEAYTAIGGWQTVRGTPIPTKSINLGMNPHLLPATNFKSSITVSTPYLHREHIVSFKFLTADMNSTLKDYLSVLRGNYQKIPPVTEDGKLTPEQEEIVSKDLARFYNGPPWQTGSQVPATTMGSRDFVTWSSLFSHPVTALSYYILLNNLSTQSMIRWEENKMVPWNAVTALGYRRPKPSLPTHFFDFITKPLRIETAPPRSDEDPGLPRRKRVKRIVCSDGPEIPMDRGVFGARVTRSC